MKLYIVLIGTGIVLLVSLLLKLCSIIYAKKEIAQSEKALELFDLLGKDVSYQKYEKISQHTSVLNNPIRLTGDFLDFLISTGDLNDAGFIENTLFKAGCGEYPNE